jgi:formimidoylglutamate deiminase
MVFVMDDVQIIEADLTWTGASFESGVQVVVDVSGEIEHVGNLDARPTHRLTDRALIPGFVNAHSHAFQRRLRGEGERFPDGAGSFWTWREAMYELVQRMDAETFYALSRQAFEEMLAAGITTVGEFHYLHHDAACDGFAFDEIVLRAARDAGIRTVLLNTFYAAGGIGKPLGEAQRRFGSRSVSEFWVNMGRLAGVIDASTQTLGVVAHSVRAASIDDIAALHAESRVRNMPFHIHVEEQRQEIEECVAAYGMTPLALLNERLDGLDNVTAIHCTHSTRADLARFLSAGGTVCLCPLTEANLADGIADVPAMIEHGGRIAVGTDSNARICMTEELRWLEYVQRLRGERRGVVRDEQGEVARRLLHIATEAGAASLGVRSGRIEPGRLADFAVIDLSTPSLRGWTIDTLLESLLFGTGNEVIAATCVGGVWRWFRAGAEPVQH